MPNRMIPCPECSAWPHVKMENCPTCKGERTIPDRRKPSETVDALRSENETLFANNCLLDQNAREADMALAQRNEEVRKLKAKVGQMRGQITEAISIINSGTDYEKAHLSTILSDALKE